MSFLADSLLSAVHLLWSLDPDLYTVIFVSLKVSLTSTLLASLLGIPAAFFVVFKEFRGKRAAMTILNTLMALPTVVIGLLVYAFLSRRGLLGSLNLLYTQTAMVIGQVILIFHIATSLTIAAIARVDRRYRMTALTLGATPVQAAVVVFREARFAVVAAVIAAFGRVISEVGISMMLGGNAKGYTRTMTTAMALEYDKGEFVLGVALGLVLLFLSFSVNVFFHYLQGRSRA